MAGESANFAFLRSHDVQLVRLGALAERYFQDDPNTCLIKLRQFAELLAQLTAAKTGLFLSTEENQADLLRRLKAERVLPPQVADLFHQIRMVGNKATHQYTGTHAEALTQLKIARHLGIWFRDVRQPTNHRRALVGWPTPEGLQAQLGIDRETAHAALKRQPYQFGFLLRPYQQRAIAAVETALERDRREMLVAMATGTGKTKLAIALLYRLLTAKRFRWVCFVVDRSALGNQAASEFRTTKVVTAKAFGDIFGIQGLGDAIPEPETKMHICTIQGLVKRVLYASEPGDIPPIDQYDLLLIDECHRGYLLDRELSDAELSFRNQDDYISKYRRVLEHFDAVKIGLTATPALHTVQIFGEPVFTYSYREAVIDGFLIDHEPPVQITTALAQSGIRFQAGEALDAIYSPTGHLQRIYAPDDLHFDVDEFNKKVITVAFNQTVARELARHYVTELTYLLFLKMLAETGKEERLPLRYRWGELDRREGLEQLEFYRQLLLDLGNQKQVSDPVVLAIFTDAQTRLRKPTNLKALTDALAGSASSLCTFSLRLSVHPKAPRKWLVEAVI